MFITNEMINAIIIWLETKSIEAFIDDDYENILYYDEEYDIKHFCKINKTSLIKIINKYDIKF